MEANKIFTVLVVFSVGIGLGYWVASTRDIMGTHKMPDGQIMANGSMMGDSMGSMMAGLNGRTGDAFDKAFLSEMIVHHEGAVEMAEAALQNAKHQEIKTMANAIISAQTSEINQMRGWLKTWYNQ
jgi:uncharacterized protein (DUF305 family)